MKIEKLACQILDPMIARTFSRPTLTRVLRIVVTVILISMVLVAVSSSQSPPPAKFTSASLLDTGFEGLSVGGFAEALATGDFNGDGKADLVAIDNAPEAAIFLGNGDGTFSMSQSFALSVRSNGDRPPANNPNLIAVGDFNGDGRLDFAVYINGGSSGANYLDVYLGDGTGHFSFSNNYTVGTPGKVGNHDSVATVDVNGDGKLDLIAGNNGDNTVTVLLGNGDGTFQSGVLYPCCQSNGYPGQIVVGDFNLDGHPDLAVADGVGGIDILLNNGNGTFQAPVFYAASVGGFPNGETGLATADLNRDGKLDVVLTGNSGAWVFLGNGNGTFQTPANYGFPYGDSVAIADVNGDKKPDLVVADLFNSSVWVLLGNGNGTFKPAVAYATDWLPESLVMADFDGDGNMDFAVGSDSGPLVTVALGNGDGTFRTGPNYDVGNWTGQVVADFNNDGNLDVAVFGSNGQNDLIQVMLGNSHGVLGAPITTTVFACCTKSISWLAAGDVNGDGKTDLVASINGPVPGQIAVFLGLGNGSFQTPVFYSTADNQAPLAVALVDVNNDRKLDALVSNADGSLSVLLNQGGGVFGTATVIAGASGTSASVIATGDFNGDGKVDVALADFNHNALNVLLGNGNGTFQAPAGFVVDHNPQWVVVGDFNKDGKLDLATGGYHVGELTFGQGGIAVLLGNGNGTFGASTYYSFYPNSQTNVNPAFGAVADVNLDGNPDLLVGLSNTHISFQCCFAPYNAGLGLFMGKGDGTFEFENSLGEPGIVGGPFLVGTGSYAVATGDFNRDGALDAAVLNQYNFGGGSGTAYVTILLNTTLPVSVSPLSITFPPQTVGTSSKARTVVLTNNQTTSLTINSITITGANAGDFTDTSKCGTKVLPGANCTISVTFKPTAKGTRTATLSVNDSVGTQSVSLKGTGK